MIDQFEMRMGYSMVPYLPALDGITSTQLQCDHPGSFTIIEGYCQI